MGKIASLLGYREPHHSLLRVRSICSVEPVCTTLCRRCAKASWPRQSPKWGACPLKGRVNGTTRPHEERPSVPVGNHGQAGSSAAARPDGGDFAGEGHGVEGLGNDIQGPERDV